MYVPDNLVECIAKGQAVVFVGSGLSQKAGLPSWNDLLLDLIRLAAKQGVSATECEELEICVADKDLLLVAEELRARLGKDWFLQFMQAEFHKTAIRPQRSHNLITQLSFCAAVTTNYDNLLENAYTLADFGESPTVFTQRDIPELANSLKSGFHILKLHGTIDRIDTIVIGLDDYRSLSYSNPSCTLYLEALFSTKTVLFIGYGFRDPDLQLVLGRLRGISANYARGHYALMNVENLPPVKRRYFEREFGIEIIPYIPQETEHPEVEAFLTELVKRVTTDQELPTVRAATLLNKLRRLIRSNPLTSDFTDSAIEGRSIIVEVGDRALTKEFVEVVSESFENLAEQYLKSDQLACAAGCFLDAASVLSGFDDEQYEKSLARSKDISSTLNVRRGNAITLGQPHEFFHIAKYCESERLRTLIRTLSYLAAKVDGTYPGIETCRLLLDCGIGIHRTRMRRYLEQLQESLGRDGHVHEGCIVCTACAIEALHSSGIWDSDKAVNGVNWLDEQRRVKWRWKTVEGQSVEYGYNYPAAAMKAFFVVGETRTASEIADMLIESANIELPSTVIPWRGIDIEDYVATGRVIEALEFCGYLPANLLQKACESIETRLGTQSARLLTREYDAWGMIGYLFCHAVVPNNVSRALLELVSPVLWSRDGSWSGSLYRTAMTARVLVCAAEKGWSPETIIGGVKP